MSIWPFVKSFVATFRIERNRGSSLYQSILWGLVFAGMSQPNKTEVK